MKNDELEALAQQLAQTDDYRVLRRLSPPGRYNPDPADPAQLRRGVYLDVETTGLDAASDAIIQLAMVPFDFTTDGLICKVGETFEQYDDPGRPIPAEVTRLTGISDADVAGQHIDADQLTAVLKPADLILAHNAGFDRPFVEARYEDFAQKAWACTMREVPWREEGLESPKLEFLAYRFGFFYDGHRAGTDCLAGIHLLAQQLPISGGTALASALVQARQTTYRVWAANAPYEARTLLKARGYRWNNGDDGQPKAWYIDVDDERSGIEQKYLKDEIYKRDIQLPIDKITCFNRYSDRV